MKRNGFTLMEVLVALMIVAMTIIATTRLWTGNFRLIQRSSLAYNVATLLERKMVEVESRYKELNFSEIPEEESGDFGSEYPQYRWTVNTRDLELPNLTPLLFGKEESPDEMLITMIQQMTDYLNQSIKELKVTIHVNYRGAERKYSATQYLVDYSKDFGGGAGAGGTP